MQRAIRSTAFAGAACGALAAALGLGSPPANPTERPRAAQRIVAHFDFEEMDINPTPVPRFWVRAQDDPDAPRSRPGFPRWNAGELVYETAAAGQGSVRLPTLGGSTSLLLERGVIPVFPGADYRISALIRTEGLKHARACIVARLLDRDGAPIEGARVRGELVHSEGEWTPTQIDLFGLYDDAAFMQVELALLQPEQAHGIAAPGAHDLRGAAWFDEVRVAMLPRMELRCAGEGILVGNEPTVIEAHIRDLAGEELDLELTLRDDTGAEVGRAAARAATGSSVTTFDLPLPPYGWFRAEVIARGGGEEVARSVLDFCRLPVIESARSAADHDRSRFQAEAGALTAELARVLPEHARRIGLGGVLLSAWPRIEDVESERMERLRSVVGTLFESGLEVTLTLDRAPELLAAELRVEPDDVWGVLTRDEPAVRAALDPYLDRFGQRVQRWRVGIAKSGDSLPSVLDGESAQGPREFLSRLVPGPTVMVPWPTFAPALGEGSPVEPQVALSGAPAESVAPLLRPWGGRASASLPRHDLERVPAREAAGDVVRRIVEAWAVHGEGWSPPGRIVLDEPWRRTSGPRPSIMPRPELAAARATFDRLAGRRVVGEMPVAAGVRCYILAGADGEPGALAAWNESAPEEQAVLRANLGARLLRTVDLYGNESEVSAGAGITIPRRPIFIEGVDIPLVRFLASLRIEPPILSAEPGVHEHEVRFRNYWPTTMEGRLSLVGPIVPGAEHAWRIAPRAARFDVKPGEEGSIPFTVSPGATTRAGRLPFLLDFELLTDRSYELLLASAPIEMAIPGLRVHATCAPAPDRGGPDLAVDVTVFSEMEVSTGAEVTIFAPGLPRERRVLGEISPGESVSRRVVFPGAAAALRGRELVVSLTDTERRARLNLTVLAPREFPDDMGK